MKFEYAGACFKGIPIATTTTTSTEPAPTPSKLCVPPDSKYNISALVRYFISIKNHLREKFLLLSVTIT